MVLKKVPWFQIFSPWFWLKTPCFSLIFLTGKSLQKFPWIPRFPWSVGTLIYFTQLTASCCCILWSFSSCSSKAIRLWSCRLLFSCDNISMFSVSSCNEFITFRFHRLCILKGLLSARRRSLQEVNVSSYIRQSFCLLKGGRGGPHVTTHGTCYNLKVVAVPECSHWLTPT